MQLCSGRRRKFRNELLWLETSWKTQILILSVSAAVSRNVRGSRGRLVSIRQLLTWPDTTPHQVRFRTYSYNERHMPTEMRRINSESRIICELHCCPCRLFCRGKRKVVVQILRTQFYWQCVHSGQCSSPVSLFNAGHDFRFQESVLAIIQRLRTGFMYTY